MPVDKGGKFHMNPQIARAHDSMGDSGEPSSDAHVIELHKHPDGHFTTKDQKDGEEKDHASSDEAHEHMKMKQGDDQDNDFDNDQQIDAGRVAKSADDGAY